MPTVKKTLGVDAVGVAWRRAVDVNGAAGDADGPTPRRRETGEATWRTEAHRSQRLCRGQPPRRMHDPCMDTRRHLGASVYAEGNPLGIDLTIWPYARVYADGITLGIGLPYLFILLFQRKSCSNSIAMQFSRSNSSKIDQIRHNSHKYHIIHIIPYMVHIIAYKRRAESAMSSKYIVVASKP
jgi:hypothetical protein